MHFIHSKRRGLSLDLPVGAGLDYSNGKYILERRLKKICLWLSAPGATEPEPMVLEVHHAMSAAVTDTSMFPNLQRSAEDARVPAGSGTM